ncbi:hypothetical protein AB0M68_03680 [Streptomyces sp. NPDC051453]|uniref:hypothetical protein n=1 Tax=Streptomyces sp. NPDC051453 TaxID=3154941 RepID=UPI0034249387
MSSWFEERRADKAADAEERRKGKVFDAKLRRDERREDAKEKREETAQRRRDRTQRRQVRAARREKTLTPGNVYRKGTLGLVTLSALASLPAQILHFVGIHWMLFPVGPAVEGAAWVMAAGVAYADERRLAAWVRWLLRALSLSAAGFAAHINYQYGLSLAHHGVDPANAQAAGLGLAAVTLGGPLFFEVRQWVLTLLAAVVDPKKRAEQKARAKHEKKRGRDHRDVVKLAKKLVSAAPFGDLMFEEAFVSAWEIKYGTRTPGMTPALHAQAHASRKALADAFDAANGSPVSNRARLLELLHPAPMKARGVTGKPQVVTDLPPVRKTPTEKPKNGARRQPPPHRRSKGDALPFHPLAKTQAATTARQHAVVNGHHH